MYNLDLKLRHAEQEGTTLPVIDDGPGAIATFIWLCPKSCTPLMLVRSLNEIQAAKAICKKLYLGEAPLIVIQRVLSSVIRYSPESRILLGFSDRHGMN